MLEINFSKTRGNLIELRKKVCSKNLIKIMCLELAARKLGYFLKSSGVYIQYTKSARSLLVIYKLCRLKCLKKKRCVNKIMFELFVIFLPFWFFFRKFIRNTKKNEKLKTSIIIFLQKVFGNFVKGWKFPQSSTLLCDRLTRFIYSYLFDIVLCLKTYLLPNKIHKRPRRRGFCVAPL